MRFTIDVLPEQEARNIRKHAVCSGPIAPLVFFVRPNHRFELGFLQIEEAMMLPESSARAVNVRRRWHRPDLPYAQRRIAGMSVDVESLSEEESDALYRHRAPWSDWSIRHTARSVLVERQWGLSLATLSMSELRAVPKRPLPVVRIRNLEVSGEFYAGLSRPVSPAARVRRL